MPSHLYHRITLSASLPAFADIWQERQSFTFLNHTHHFRTNIDWNYLEYGKLWTYNLNYFEFLHTPKLDTATGMSLIKDFNRDLSARKEGMEPYPTSLRIIHTIKFLIYQEIEDADIDRILFQQLHILLDKLEYHILGNHLLENGFALLFGAYYFQDEYLYHRAKSILLPELEEQILTDGAHFELSPMYHQLMLYRVLDCYNLVKNNVIWNKELESLLHGYAKNMLGWLKAMTFSNGDIPLLNDSAKGITPSTKDLQSYASRLGISSSKNKLSTSGYRTMVMGNYEAVVDIGAIGPDYLPGHAHADIFHFILYYYSKPVFTDTGISTYEIGESRIRERSTFSHNTVFLPPYEQAEVWGGFRVAQRGKPIIEQESNTIIKASLHYQKIKALHTRIFNFQENRIVIEDKLNGHEQGIANFHLHPNIMPIIKNSKVVLSPLISMQFEGTDNIRLDQYEYAEAFNKRQPAPKLVVNFSQKLRTVLNFKE
ncbi:alginate lyase family protein [Phaeodactylibacter xiamenensis]|uniref:alginate lyase family protein n=1 Tax=Phaeodactylibacter xiamenensis TaxID=1524460 RepID=UPI0024A94892|nr:alginate lyase family protein [Phaeodactylibacter xiamenensis]